MRWILCKQTLHDSVCYSTSESEEFSYLSYYTFLEYIHSLLIIDFIGFKEKLDKFDVLLVDLDAHTWKVYEDIVEQKEATFEELVKLNDESQRKPSSIDRIKLKLAQFSKMKTYGGESANRETPDKSSTSVINREVRRGARIPLKGERSKY